MTVCETKCDAINWHNLERTVADKLVLLKAAWQESECTWLPEAHAKMVTDLYVPILALLAQFCASIEEKIEEPNE